MSFLKLYRDLDDSNLTSSNSSQTQSVASTVQGYVCSDVRTNITCPVATGNPDIAGLGVIVSFTITLLLPIAFTVLVMIMTGLQYCYTYTRATVASTISEGNDILPVWPERYARYLGKPSVGLSTSEWRLKRTINYALSMTLGLCDQVLLSGIIFLILQIIGLARGTMNNLDFHTLAALVSLCAQTQLFCLYTLQPVLTGLDLPMLTTLQWSYLDRTSKDMRKDLEYLTHSPEQFRKDLVLYIRNSFCGLHKEAKDMIDRVHLTVADSALSGRLIMRFRIASHIILLVALPLELLASMLSDTPSSDRGCPARCMFGQDGYAYLKGTPSFDMIGDIVLIVLLYLIQVLQILWPRTMRRVFLLIRLLLHHLAQVFAKGRTYLTFTISLVLLKYPKMRILTIVDGVIDACLISIVPFLLYTNTNLFFLLPQDFVVHAFGDFTWVLISMFFVVQKAELLFLPQLVFLYDEAVVAASLSSASQSTGGEGQWTNGQILPLLMLAGTLLVVVQNSSGGGTVDTSTNSREATIGQRFPYHPAFDIGDKLLNTQIERIVGAVSIWDLWLPSAVLYTLFHRGFSYMPIPGDTWSPKGLHHLGLMSDNDTSADKIITISQDQRLEVLKEILESNAYTWFSVIDWNMENIPKYTPNQILTPELDDALEKLETMKARLLEDMKFLDWLPNVRLKTIEYIAVAVTVLKYHRNSTADAENSSQQTAANVTQGHSTK